MMGGPNSPLPPPPRAAATNLELTPGKLVEPYTHHEYGGSKGYRIACPAALPTEKKAESLGLALEEYADQAGRGTLRHELTASLDEIPPEHRWAVERARAWFARWDGEGYWEVPLPVTVGDKVITWSKADRVVKRLPRPFVGDVKHGEGLPEVEHLKWQMKLGAVGAGQLLGVNEVDVGVYHVVSGTEWLETYRDLDTLALWIEERIEHAKANPNKYSPTMANCRFCRGKTVCPAWKEQIDGAICNRPDSVPVPILARYLEFAQVIDPWVKKLREHAKKLMTEGMEIPGWELVQRTMPRMKSEKTGETYTQTVLRKKNGGTE